MADTDTQDNTTTTTENKPKQFVKKKDRKDLEIPEGVDPWKAVPLSRDDVPKRVLYDDSSFSTLFPKYKEKYLREIWPLVEKQLGEHGIVCKIDLLEGSMSVTTTKKCWDPVAILKARDLIRLLSRAVPYIHASKIMDDENNCDIIKIGGYMRNKERFIKRRQRLLGPDGATLKSIELLTKCYVMIQGTTVAAIGPWNGLLQVRKIVEDCMKNIHPIYNIKELMIKRELMKDDSLKNESWERFLPKFKKTNAPSKKAPIAKKKKDKNAAPFAPDQMPRKIDIEMASGEYFLSSAKKAEKLRLEREAKQAGNLAKRQEERAKAFVAPAEKSKSSNDGSSESQFTNTSESLQKIKSSLGNKKRKETESLSADDFIQKKNKK
ncbi:hypothetical protein SAMD00019534_108600 [Acytostelium subglobosum LB1]|uniref:hypothetical protein n=1 Tax=Acytostelium subglobosum LB1 TaxID=1410327 RepID=UPI000644B5D7|nr:hypothetical protein SAMD00019534_108600 [Acytostelium subglobosum LB1]GAM27684.1 hypothetical protein SAMD00019534_108600 [Acytostelium subglobosum LB1]|eukprot:XP_012749343.1 hypothetical protein SAMD00019534_108600 [Acytostelium subglobosum LB1]